MTNRCCVKNCKSRRKNFTLHSFPISREKVLLKWVQHLNRAKAVNLDLYELHKFYICELHFEKRFFNPITRHLRSEAYPTLFTEDDITSGIPKVNEDGGDRIESTIKPLLNNINTDHSYQKKRLHHDHSYSKLSETPSVPFQTNTYQPRSRDMGIITCCVDGCKSQKKDTVLFSIPTQNNLRNVWLKMLIPVAPSLAKMNKTQLVLRKVCQRHFEDKYLTVQGNRRKILAFPTLFTEEEILSRKPATQINALWKVDGNFSNDHTYASHLLSNATIFDFPQDHALSLADIVNYIYLDHNYSEAYKARRLLLVSSDGEQYAIPNYEVPNVAVDTQNDEAGSSTEIQMETKEKEDPHKLMYRRIDGIKVSNEEYQRLTKENERIGVQLTQQTTPRLLEESEEDLQRRLEIQRNMLRLQKDEEPRERSRQLLKEQFGLHRKNKRKGNINKDTDNPNYDDIDASRFDTHAAIKGASDIIHRIMKTSTLTRSVPMDAASEPKYELQNLLNSTGESKYSIVGEGGKIMFYLKYEKDVGSGAVKELVNEEIDHSSGDISNDELGHNGEGGAGDVDEYDGVVKETEFSYGEDLLGDFGDNDLDGGIGDYIEEQSVKDGPFSWQKFTEEELFPLDEKLYEDDVMFCGESQLVPDLCDPSESQIQEEFSCNVCNEAITGCRYCCVVCADWDLCGACEARGEHSHHYVLRIPRGKTYKETQSVLAALRRLLEDLALHEDPDLTVIKDEVKTEDPLGDIDRDPGELQENAVDDSRELSEDIHEEIQNEDFYSDHETIVAATDDTDFVIEVPTDTVPNTHKRKTLHTVDSNIPKKRLKHAEPNFVMHYDENTNEAIFVDLSQNNVEKSTNKDIVVPHISGDNFIQLQTVENGFIALQTQNNVITQAGNGNFIELPLETGETIRLQVDNDFIASPTENNLITQTGNDNFIELATESGEVIRLPVNDLITSQTENNFITQTGNDNFIELATESGEVTRLLGNDLITSQTENNLITQTGNDNFIELATESGEIIRLLVNDLITSQTENNLITRTGADNFIELPLETGGAIRLQVDNDLTALQSGSNDVTVLDDSVLNNAVLNTVETEFPYESLTTGMLEMSSMANCMGTNDVRYMTLDGQLLDVIDCSKEYPKETQDQLKSTESKVPKTESSVQVFKPTAGKVLKPTVPNVQVFKPTESKVLKATESSVKVYTFPASKGLKPTELGVQVLKPETSAEEQAIDKEITYEEEYMEPETLDDDFSHEIEAQPKEEGPFSWHKYTEETVALDKNVAGDDGKICGEAQLVPDSSKPVSQTQEESLCNACNHRITAFRYVCVVCPDWDLCGACEALQHHAQHYVLRVPPGKPHSETAWVIATLRQMLASREQPDLPVVKEEVKSEHPLADMEDDADDVPEAGKVGLPAGGSLSLFCPGGETEQPPPGIPPPYQLDSKLAEGLTLTPVYPPGSTDPMLGPEMSQVAASWHTPSMYSLSSAASEFRSPNPMLLPISSSSLSRSLEKGISSSSSDKPAESAANGNNEEQNKKPHIKKPMNAFILYSREMRAKVVAEYTLKESSAITQVLGRQWRALGRDEQAKYYELARRERQLHMQLYPEWKSKKRKYKKRKRKQKTTDGENNLKKCRARYGLYRQDLWCAPCRRKKKCLRYKEALAAASGGSAPLPMPTPQSPRSDEDLKLEELSDASSDSDTDITFSIYMH